MSKFDFTKHQEQLIQATDKARQQLSQGWHEAVEEFRRVAAGLGVNWNEEPLSPAKALEQIKRNNPDLKTLFRSLDTATFETRAKLKWNARMALRYAQLEGKKQYQVTVQPKLHKAKDHLLQTSDQLTERLEELRARLKKAS